MLSDEQIINNLPVKEIIRKFPKSGQKQVLLVKNIECEQIILKIVEGSQTRVEREIEIIKKYKFDNVPNILDVNNYSIGNESGIYLFEEFIDGDTLKSIISSDKLNIDESLELANQLLQIIVEMESKKVVHRDIKPENIIRGKNKKWYLIDFGIARVLGLTSLTLTEVNIGPHTPGYGAPELFQYSKKDIDSRADIFSLGIVLFEAVTGKHPFLKGDEINLNQIWYNTLTVQPEQYIIKDDYDMQFISLIETYMQKHITRRPKTSKKAMEWLEIVTKNIRGGNI